MYDSFKRGVCVVTLDVSCHAPSTCVLLRRTACTVGCMDSLQVRVNWFSELLEALVRFRPEVLQDVLKVVFFAKIKLEGESEISDESISQLFTTWLGNRLSSYLHERTPCQASGCFPAEYDPGSQYAP